MDTKLKIKKEEIIEQKNNLLELSDKLNEANNAKFIYFTKFTLLP